MCSAAVLISVGIVSFVVVTLTAVIMLCSLVLGLRWLAARIVVGAMMMGCSHCVENEFNVPIALSAFRDKDARIVVGAMVVGCSLCCWGYDDGLLALLLGLWWWAARIVVGVMMMGCSHCCWGYDDGLFSLLLGL